MDGSRQPVEKQPPGGRQAVAGGGGEGGAGGGEEVEGTAAARLPSEAPRQWDQFQARKGASARSGPGLPSRPVSGAPPPIEAARTESQAGLGERCHQTGAAS